ncbi:amidohydrolase family protein [Patescibacteria group bacterium]|nr:amidohydrolase family protein [Patescibacteria group bacterium]MBU1123740.1 amidohydrolase family protein [Patescibacteria group bacterium]MBU1911892.1 amidohydrolase family protein [Patescibacteria group bacterium]
MKPYRGTILRPDSTGEYLEMIDDALVIVDDEGEIVVADSVSILCERGRELREKFGLVFDEQMELDGKPIPQTHNIIMPVTANTHDHSFQPPGIDGPLITGTPTEGFGGWLPKTLKNGEYIAKQDVGRSRAMLAMKFEECIRHGVGATLQFTTSSYDAARAAINIGNDKGVRVVAGYVAMDQNIDSIQLGLQEESGIALRATEALLDEFGAACVAVIDRFPIAVSSETRRGLAELARHHGALYETHFDEQDGVGREKDIHKSIYGTASITQTLVDDGVFETGSRVGLAHSIHTTKKEMDLIGSKVDAGCKVFVRACPSSNAQLGSHFVEGAFVPFPLRQWEARGVDITLGTDRGAGRTSNVFAEMQKEHGRHSIETRPSFIDVLRYGTIQGLKSLGVDIGETRVSEGNPAEFTIVELSGAGAYWDIGDHYGNLEFTAARVIDGGQDSSGIKALWVKGRQLK